MLTTRTKRLRMMVLLCIPGILLTSTPLTGTVDYPPYLGVQLTIPDGWKGVEDGDYLLLGSDTERGVMGIALNPAQQIAELQTVADAGWVEEGINMRCSGDLTPIGAEGLAAEFSGTFQ